MVLVYEEKKGKVRKTDKGSEGERRRSGGMIVAEYHVCKFIRCSAL